MSKSVKNQLLNTKVIGNISTRVNFDYVLLSSSLASILQEKLEKIYGKEGVTSLEVYK